MCDDGRYRQGRRRTKKKDVGCDGCFQANVEMVIRTLHTCDV